MPNNQNTFPGAQFQWWNHPTTVSTITNLENPQQIPPPPPSDIPAALLEALQAQAFSTQNQQALANDPPYPPEDEEKGQTMHRPEIGPQVVALAKIRNSRGMPRDRDLVDRRVDEISEKGVPLLEVFWDQHGWEAGFVMFHGDAAILVALRELGFHYITCNVQIDPKSGLMGDIKVPYVDPVELILEEEVA